MYSYTLYNYKFLFFYLGMFSPYGYCANFLKLDSLHHDHALWCK